MAMDVTMRRLSSPSGFTLLELMVALGLLFTLVAGTSLLLANAHRHEEALWDELLAEELAVSVLEQELAAEHCAAMPPEGLSVPLSQLGPRETTSLPEAKAVLHASPVSGSSVLLNLQVIVSWSRYGATRTLVRGLRRRATP